MPRILLIDDRAIFRDRLSTAFRLAGYETETAHDGNDGLAKARAATPDLILLDLSTPGVDGLDVVEAIRGIPALKTVPVIFLAALTDRRTVLRAATLGIKDYLLKSRFSIPEILERAQKYAPNSLGNPAAVAVAPRAAENKSPPSPSDLPRLLTREQCLSRVESATAARPMSGVVAQVISMAGSPLVEMSEMASLIGRDPVLSARLLRAANCAAFAGAKKVVTNINDAVRNIGLSTVRNIATALSVFEAVPAGGADGFHHLRSWQHSFATAMICQQMSEISKAAESGAAYLVGLCHNLGEILFRGEFGNEYGVVLKTQAQTGRPLEEIERHMLGATQLDLAKVILKKMSLPPTIRQPIEEFHAAKSRNGRQPATALARILRVAELYANGILMAAFPTSEVGPIAKSECRAVVGRDDPPRPDPGTIRDQILALTPLLARLSADDERKLCQPLLPATDKHVWLTRAEAYSNFDPLAVALQSLAQTKVSASLPQESQRPEYDLLVVAAPHRYPLPLDPMIPVLRLSPEPAPRTQTPIIECSETISLERLAEFIASKPQAARKAA